MRVCELAELEWGGDNGQRGTDTECAPFSNWFWQRQGKHVTLSVLVTWRTTLLAEMPESFHQWLMGPNASSEAVGDPTGAFVGTLLLLTHVTLGVAAMRAYYWRLIRLGNAALWSFLVSLVLYHPCRLGLYCLDQPLDVWRRADHTMVLNLLGVFGLHVLLFALGPPQWRVLDLVVGYAVFPLAFVAVSIAPFTVASAVVILVFLVILAVLRVCLLACSRHKKRRHTCPTKAIVFLVLGLVTGGAGFVLYFLSDSTPHDDTMAGAVRHSFWHLLSGLALIFVTEATAIHLVRELEHED